MKIYWIVLRIVIGWLLIQLGIDTGLWIAAGLGVLVALSALSELMRRFARAMEAIYD